MIKYCSKNVNDGFRVKMQCKNTGEEEIYEMICSAKNALLTTGITENELNKRLKEYEQVRGEKGE